MCKECTEKWAEIKYVGETSNQPYVCPVCNGNGLVPNGFYEQTSGYWSTTSITPVMCRSCNGTGIVWKP